MVMEFVAVISFLIFLMIFANYQKQEAKAICIAECEKKGLECRQFKIKPSFNTENIIMYSCGLSPSVDIAPTDLEQLKKTALTKEIKENGIQ